MFIGPSGTRPREKCRRHDAGREGAPSISEGSMSADRISVAIDPFLRHREKELAYDFVASLADPFSFISLQAVGKKFLTFIARGDRGSFFSLFYYLDLVHLVYEIRSTYASACR